MEFTLLAAAALGVAALYLVIYWEAKRGNAADCSRDLWDTALVAGMVGLIVGRLAAMILAGSNPVTRPADVIIVRGGVDTVWASGAALGTLAVLARRETLLLADGLAAAVLAGLAGWHSGCLFRDGCLGTPSDLPWAYPLSGSDITRHPVELYAAVLLAAGALAIMLWRRHRPHPGVLGAVALAVASGTRWLTEPLRPALSSSLTPWYATATFTALAVAVGLALRARQRASPHLQ
jgi:prolipoprotein diacylglyceryltransferase